MKNKQDTEISIAGAGLVGSLLACFLGQEGYKVKIFERRPDPRKGMVDAGRSINLALSDRGWKALASVGMEEKVRELAIPMRRRTMHDKEGNLSYQPYGKEGQAIYSVSRAGLNAMLMQKAEQNPDVEIFFDQRCDEVDLSTATATFTHYNSGESQQVKSDVLFGTDGAFSAVRGAMQKTDRFDYSQHYIQHGYKELTIPPNEDGTHRMEREALHIWPRGSYMLIALPNPDGSFTCTLFLAFEGKQSYQHIDTLDKGRAFFRENFRDALELMPDFDREWEENPFSSMVIIRCYPWSRNGKVCLLGDAAHAIVPFYGQGMNSGFEDCSVLHEIMEKHEGDWSKIFNDFEQQRKPDADAISDLAMRNFVEMRDLTGQPDFLLRKKIEARFSERHPDLWTPLYSMVTFSHIRYSEALREGQRQDAVMAELMKRPGIHHDWNSEEVDQEMERLVQKYNGL